jgi:NADH dehydrogenase [ubiquinone] 1 alpha subcomplex assembly factor 7
MSASDIEKLIASEGPVSVERFMRLATSAYYAKGTAFGREGDFTTAPEISQVFGELVGAWCCLVWEALGRPAPFHLVELGPGRGTLMADLLRAATALPGFLDAARLHLVETSQTLRERQKTALAGFAPAWHAEIGELPNDAPLILVGNEFLDALAIRQYVKTTSGWHERLIGIGKDGKLQFLFEQTPSLEPPVPDFLADAPPGSIVETNPQALALIDHLAKRFRNTPGAALFIDYGPLESGIGDSLQAVKGHAFAPVLQDPGASDLTAHVDFAALVRQANAQGLGAWGPVPQGVWLQRLGIVERTRQLATHANSKQGELLISGTRRLIDPQEMGTLFKVLAVAPPSLSVPPGFEVT